MTMRNAVSVLLAATIFAAGTLTLSACEERDGPLERAGEKIDKAIDNVADND